MRRFFSERQRQTLALRAGGRCEQCGDPLPSNFHADHRHPFSHGGATILSNGQALCPSCNQQKGTKMVKLRNWQTEAHDQAIDWLANRGEDRHFLLNAAPGSGKTLVSCVIANTLIKRGLVERVVVIAPRTEVVNQWAQEFSLATGRHMNKITGQDAGFHAMGLDVCATWAAISALKDGFQQMCEAASVLVICDEHHHAAVAAAWGETADSAFAKASYVLVLTGTPVRSDGAQAIWLPYHADGGMAQPAAGTYTLTYGEAVDLGYCRPVTFHRHEGRFRVALGDGTELEVSGRSAAQLPQEHPAAKLWRRALDYQSLAALPQVDAAGAPRLDSYHASMVDWASSKLDELRDRMPRAGGLVIAPSIDMAQYFARLIEMKEGTPPVVVHSQMANAESRINTFRRTDARWIVSVAMVSEGVDIPRLRVLVYLPNAMTEVSFRQAVGRVVRSAGPDDDTRAYVVMPTFGVLDDYARRVEEEMPEGHRTVVAHTHKRCPACRTEVERGAPTCPECAHSFSVAPPRFVTCPSCNTASPERASSCQTCGHAFSRDFTLTLDEALRDGAISRGQDVSEADLAFAAAHADRVRDLVLKSGDRRIIGMLRTFPEECLGRMKRIFDALAD